MVSTVFVVIIIKGFKATFFLIYAMREQGNFLLSDRQSGLNLFMYRQFIED